MKLGKSNEKNPSSHSFYSRRGEQASRRVARIIAQKSWRWHLFNLAWTAGPVTLVALYLGHVAGYGSGPSKQLLLYFSIYSLVAGIFALSASLAREILMKPKVEAQQNQLLEAVDHLFGALLHSRDVHLNSLNLEERKILAAYYTLQTAGSSAEAIKGAVWDLTEDVNFVRAVERVFGFNEQGMYSRIRDDFQTNHEALQGIREEIEPVAPKTFQLFTQWMQGTHPRTRNGRERPPGFLQRTIQASLKSDLSLMAAEDTYEVLTLVFELLNGRRIEVLTAHFSGNPKLALAKKKLDMTFRRYRVARRRKDSAYRLLFEELSRYQALEVYVELPRSERDRTQDIRRAIQELSAGEKARIKPFYQRLQNADQQVQKVHQELFASESDYVAAWNLHGENLLVSLEREDLQGAGFYIEQDSLQLDDTQKLLLAQEVHQRLPSCYRAYGEEKMKEVAIELLLTVDQWIDLHNPDIQLAIESSNALQIGYLQPDFTPSTLMGWAQLGLGAMHENKKRASHQLAEHLVAHYCVVLSEALVDLLTEEFGADRSYLRSLQSKLTRSRKGFAGLSLPPEVTIPPWMELTS